MKKVLKILFLISGAVALLLIAAAVAIKLLFPPEKVRALIEKEVAARFHRELKLGGVSVGLFSGLSLSQVSLSEAPSFEKGTFVSLDRLVIRPRLLPLLAKQLFIRDIELVNPTINVTRMKEGTTFNFSSLLAPASSTSTLASPTASSGTSPLVFVVSRARIENGTVRFVDLSTAAQSALVENLNLNVRNVSLTGPVDVQSSARLTALGITADIDFTGDVNALKGSARIKELGVKSGAINLTAHGEVRDGMGPTPLVDLTISIPTLEPAKLSKILPLPADYTMEGTLSVDVTLKGTRRDLAFDTKADLKPMRLNLAKNFVKAAGSPLTVSARGRYKDERDLELDEAQIFMEPLTLTLKGTVAAVASASRRIQLSFQSPNISLPGLAKMAPAAVLPTGVSLDGPLSLSGDVQGATEQGRLRVSADATAVDVRYGTSFQKKAGQTLLVQADGPFSSAPSFETKNLTITLADMTLSGDALYQSQGTSSNYSAALKSNNFSLQTIAAMAPAATPYAPTGKALITARVNSGAKGLVASGTFRLEEVSARYQKSQLTSLTGAGSFTLDSVDIPSLKGKLNSADLVIALNAKNVSAHPVITSDIRLAEMDVSKFLPDTPTGKKTRWFWDNGERWALSLVAEAQAAPVAPSAPLLMDASGKVLVGKVKHDYLQVSNLSLVYDVKDASSALDKIKGKMELKTGAGNVTNLKKLVEDSAVAKAVLLPLSILQKSGGAGGAKLGLPSLDPLPFQDIVGDYRFRPGWMDIVAFALNSDQLKVGMTGTIGLVGTQSLNLKAAVTLPPKGLGQAVGQVLGDGQGGAALHLVIKGTIAAPEPSLDKTETGKQLLSSPQAEKIKSQVQDLLKGIFK